ncbi:hypothetical protein FS749_005862 [Ceratobasidium sp. UAMH 11750]|nr:hypothetical protein FS749_005862 [Ceratobasidium sp. UAMH 11750]
MDSLTEGPYRLRYLPSRQTVEESNDSYATRVDGVGNPVTVSSTTQSSLDSENWWFSKTADGKHWFILGQGSLPKQAGLGPVSLGFGNGVVKQGTPIIFAAALGEYVIKALNNGEYIIEVAPTNYDSKPPEVDYVVGVSSGGTLEVQEVTAPAEGQAKVPKWSFQKVK